MLLTYFLILMICAKERYIMIMNDNVGRVDAHIF